MARKLATTAKASKSAAAKVTSEVPAVEFSDTPEVTSPVVEATAAAPAPVVAGPSAKQLRQFAADSGLEVKARGILPKAVHEAFAKSPAKLRKKYLTV